MGQWYVEVQTSMQEMIVFKWMSQENGSLWDLLWNIELIMFVGTCQVVASNLICTGQSLDTHFVDGALMLLGGDYDEQSTEVFNTELGSGIC